MLMAITPCLYLRRRRAILRVAVDGVIVAAPSWISV